MKNTIKRISLLLITVCVLCMGLFMAACGADNTYSVTVVYEDGTAVDGTTAGTGFNSDTGAETQLFAQWCTSDGALCADLVPVDANGKASVSAETLQKQVQGRTDLHVKVSGVPEGYTFDEVEITSTGNVTIVLKKI